MTIVLATEHVERERDTERKEESQSGECDTGFILPRGGQDRSRGGKSGKIEAGRKRKKVERKRKKKLIGSGDFQSGDRYANSDRSEVDA